MRFWELGRFALENIVRSKMRTLLTVAGVAIASGALVSMVGFILGLREQVEKPINQLGLLNNIEVKPISNPKETRVSPPLTKAMLEEFRQLDGVDIVFPDFRLAELDVSYADKTERTYAFGIPRESALLGYTRDLLAAGEFFSIGKANEVILGTNLVEPLGFEKAEDAIGVTIRVTAGGLVSKDEKQFQYEERALELIVVGVFDPPKFASSLNPDAIVLPVDIMGEMPSSWMEKGLNQLRAKNGRVQQGYPTVIVRAKSPRDVMRIEASIRELGYATLSVLDRLKELRQFFVFMEVLLTAVGTVALVVAGLGILNTLTMTVMERYQEIGIYKAIGASHGDIRWMFLVEAATVGFLGGLAGLVLARVVSWILRWAFNTYAFQQGVDGPEAVFLFPSWLLLASVAYSIAVSVLSGLYPAAKAANVDPIDALRRG